MMKYVTLALALLVQSSCVGQKKQNDSVNDIDIFFRQYAYLLQRSFEYDREHERFKYEVIAFVDTCTEYNHGTDTFIKPFISQSGRGEPIILHPYLFNTNQDRVIIMVLTKDKDMADKPVEEVRYVLGNKENGKWTFRKRKGVRNFRYEGGHPLLSDTEMSLRTLRTLIDWGYMSVDKVGINDKFFDKDW